MKKTIFYFLVAVSMSSCGRKTENPTPASVQAALPHVPEEMEALMQKSFPGAMTVPEFADSILGYLQRKYQVVNERILLGASTCVDDIIYTKNFKMHTEIKGPFHLGGLAGLPFTGISGLDAFAHHIPDSGTLMLLVEPHIGLSEKAGWGYVLRHEQHEASSCCGALMGTLGELQKGTLSPIIREEDYQGGKIGELALQHKSEILEAANPIIELTKLTSFSAEKQIRSHVLEVEMEHVKYIVIITGVLINTDYTFTDYQYVDHIMIYDVGKKRFVEDLRNPHSN